MDKKNINRDPARKTVSYKETAKGSRTTTKKKKRVSANFFKMSMNNQEECSFSELELFKRPVVQSNILNGKFAKIFSITKLEDSEPIEFLVENATDHFFHLRQSYLNTKFKVVNSDGSNLAGDTKVG